MRLFVGIKSSAYLQNQVREWQQAHHHLSVRFIQSENLHLTLIPPGIIQEPASAIEKLQCMEFSRLLIRFKAPEVNLKNHLIWIEADPVQPELTDIYRQLAEKFSHQRRRDWLPHVTLARFKKFPGAMSITGASWVDEVDNLTLFESLLKPGGACYKEIFRLPAAG